MTPLNFAELLKSERQRLAKRQSEMAELLGVSVGVYKHWESGRRTPTELTQFGAVQKIKNHDEHRDR